LDYLALPCAVAMVVAKHPLGNVNVSKDFKAVIVLNSFVHSLLHGLMKFSARIMDITVPNVRIWEIVIEPREFVNAVMGLKEKLVSANHAQEIVLVMANANL